MLRIIAWVVAVAAMSVAGYWALAPGQGGMQSTTNPSYDVQPAPGFEAAAADQSSVVISSAPRTPPEGAKEYRDTAYRFSLLYPETLSIARYDEGGGAATVTFQNAARAEGFQIFIVPYTAPSVSESRFRQDQPSSVIEQPLNVRIAGVPATSFYGRDAFLGDTAEIWFIYDGYLYEVTAPKSQAQWLSDIMNTWQFI